MAGMAAAHSLIGETNALLGKPNHMKPSLIEAGARLFVTRFLGTYISAGCLILLEEGDTILTFEGDKRKCSMKIVLKVHNPQFYWKIMTRADLGLADAYIDGDISFTDENEGLLNLFLILIASRESKSSILKLNKRRGWWTPLIFTAAIGSASYFLKHFSRQNTLTQARRNISRHYELSNELFALFLDETMTYSTAVFKKEDEDLKVAQLRKMSTLIEKARINERHEVLDIGCGWGSFAIEVVNRTGCKYTGITLSNEQLKLAEKKVKDAGLQDRIKFLLYDYRQLPDSYKYDRIISCEMIEHVGHEYMEEFFGCCESLLAEDGLFVLQFISIPDERYDEYRRSSDFIKEYIFPGGCLPSLSRIISAMANASRLCVEHVENIGIHYYQTLICWRKNLMDNQSKILALGFDEKFIRTWEYYFDYCAAGFKSRTLGDYQAGEHMAAANSLVGKKNALLSKPKHVEPSLIEAGARLFVTRFLGRYISAGCLTLLEEDGTVLTFEGDKTKCSLKVVLKVHNPQFYWKIMTRADLGLADAYIDGDISFADENEGLLNLFLLLIASRDSKSSISKLDKRRSWWTPLIFTAAIGSASYCFKHLLRQNSLTQARRNISRHYELSNELFALYLDETMTYSTGLFKREDEDLKVAQLRKISSLIEKARIDEKHEILDIGCGWGSFAIEVVNQTGCKYTGITLSKEQLKLAEQKVKDAGLQDHIKLLLCDYRQLPDTYKYDRIISCEMIEHVGHEYMEEFFRCCDSLLAEDGLFVLQFISIPDQRYDQHRRSADFMKEYIFPGGCLPSLNSVISAMANASRFCVEHVENIGIHYYQTLRYWRKNFMDNRRKILALGFDEKFMRTWEYYFDYCASGFKSRTLGDYQVVFSRPGNFTALNKPYQSFHQE